MLLESVDASAQLERSARAARFGVIERNAKFLLDDDLRGRLVPHRVVADHHRLLVLKVVLVDVIERGDGRLQAAAGLAPRLERAVHRRSAPKLLVLRQEGSQLLLVAKLVPTWTRTIRAQRGLRQQDERLAVARGVRVELFVRALFALVHQRIVGGRQPRADRVEVALAEVLKARVGIAREHLEPPRLADGARRVPGVHRRLETLALQPHDLLPLVVGIGLFHDRLQHAIAELFGRLIAVALVGVQARHRLFLRRLGVLPLVDRRRLVRLELGLSQNVVDDSGHRVAKRFGRFEVQRDLRVERQPFPVRRAGGDVLARGLVLHEIQAHQRSTTMLLVMILSFGSANTPSRLTSRPSSRSS